MFTQEQIKQISNNKYIEKCSSKSITYKPEFKLLAIKKYFNEGLSPRMIFEEAGLSIKIVGYARARDSLLRWRKKYKSKGAKGLKESQKGKSGGRPPKIKFKNDKEKIKYLEAKITYMDAENDFLAKLRGIKRE